MYQYLPCSCLRKLRINWNIIGMGRIFSHAKNSRKFFSRIYNYTMYITTHYDTCDLYKILVQSHWHENYLTWKFFAKKLLYRKKQITVWTSHVALGPNYKWFCLVSYTSPLFFYHWECWHLNDSWLENLVAEYCNMSHIKF